MAGLSTEHTGRRRPPGGAGLAPAWTRPAEALEHDVDEDPGAVAVAIRGVRKRAWTDAERRGRHGTMMSRQRVAREGGPAAVVTPLKSPAGRPVRCMSCRLLLLCLPAGRPPPLRLCGSGSGAEATGGGAHECSVRGNQRPVKMTAPVDVGAETLGPPLRGAGCAGPGPRVDATCGGIGRKVRGHLRRHVRASASCAPSLGRLPSPFELRRTGSGVDAAGGEHTCRCRSGCAGPARAWR